MHTYTHTKYMSRMDPKVHGPFSTPGCHHTTENIFFFCHGSSRIKNTKLCMTSGKQNTRVIFEISLIKWHFYFVYMDSIKKFMVPLCILFFTLLLLLIILAFQTLFYLTLLSYEVLCIIIPILLIEEEVLRKQMFCLRSYSY